MNIEDFFFHFVAFFIFIFLILQILWNSYRKFAIWCWCSLWSFCGAVYFYFFHESLISFLFIAHINCNWLKQLKFLRKECQNKRRAGKNWIGFNFFRFGMIWFIENFKAHTRNEQSIFFLLKKIRKVRYLKKLVNFFLYSFFSYVIKKNMHPNHQHHHHQTSQIICAAHKN